MGTNQKKDKKTSEDGLTKVQIFDNIYDYDALPAEVQKLFILQHDIRRDLAFRHAQADAALKNIRQDLERELQGVPSLGKAK